MKVHGKKYCEVLKLFDKNKLYSIEEASSLIKKTSITKFDSSISLSVHLNVGVKPSNQVIKNTVILPHNNGNKKKILAITNLISEAKDAGADYVGGKDMIDKIAKENWFGYDVIVATPDMMVEIGKIGHILGPKGLMPNPKVGTISNDIKKMIKEIKNGKIEYHIDKNGNVNVTFARVSFSEKQIEENLHVLCSSILKDKPNLNKNYVLNSVIHTTMGPAIHIDI